MKNARFILICALVVIGMATRLFPHWPNFTALGAAAIMAGAFFRNKVWAFTIPLITLFLSDLILNNIVYSAYNEGFTFFTEGFIWIYLGFAVNVFIGLFLKGNVKIVSTALAAVFGALSFYLLSNIGAWLSIPLYSKDITGLMEAYVAGLPFLANQVFANVVYCAIFFGTVWALTPRLKPSAVKA